MYTRGGGGNLPWFWVRVCGWSPRTPPHSYTRLSEKHDPFIYFPYRKLTPFIYHFWKLTPFIYYFSNFTHSYTFWVKKISHYYTLDVKMIPIHILGGLKSIPHSSRTSVYTFIMEVTPPPPPVCVHLSRGLYINWYHQFMTLLLHDLMFYWIGHHWIYVSIRHLRRMWHADRGRLLLRTPDPVPFGTCICSTCWEQLFSRTCGYSPEN